MSFDFNLAFAPPPVRASFRPLPATAVATALRHAAARLALPRKWVLRAWHRRVPAALSDHLLDDIGLTRADARRIAEMPFWRD